MKTRNILYAAAFAAVLTSCAREELIKDINDGYQEYKISASIINTPGTRTYMGEMGNNGAGDFYPVFWSPGDKVALFSKNSVGVFTLNQITATDSTEAVFVGNAGDMPLQFDGTEVYPAAYPADNAFATIDSDGNLFVGSYLPYMQTFKDGTFADDVFPMAAASDDGQHFGFYNLCGVIQIPIMGGEEGQVIRSIYLTGNNDEVVAGGIGMKFNPETGEPITDGTVAGDENKGKKIAKYGKEGFTRVIVDLGSQPLELSSTEEKYVNIAVIPQQFENGFTIEFVDGQNMGRSSFKIVNSTTIKRSTVTRMRPITYVKPEPLQIANSYVYDQAGYYLMPAYAMGNRMDVMLPTAGRRLAADLLWSEIIKPSVSGHTTDREDLLPAVTNIEYLNFEDGYGMIQFKINIDPDTGDPYRGNAAIALYDVDTKEVIWSWHLWMTETVHDVVTGGSCSAGTYSYDLPDGTHVDYAAEASSGQLIIMDRNLGAISANPADGWKTYGLYYQNGRRDPFIGGHWDGDPNKGTQAEFKNPNDNLKVRLDESAPFTVGATDTAPVWYNEELAPKGWNWIGRYQNISTALRFPMTFSAGYDDNNGQWTDYDGEDGDNKSWMDPNVGGNKKKGGNTSGGTHGNTGLSDGGHQAYWNRTKTIMDPCPIGYSVLGEEGGLFLGNGDTKTYIFEAAGGSHPDHGVYGMLTQKSGQSQVWWPAAGVRTISGYLGGVGYQGMYFHYDHIAAKHGGHGSSFYNGGGWTAGTMTNQAASVRCVREKQFSDLTRYPLK